MAALPSPAIDQQSSLPQDGMAVPGLIPGPALGSPPIFLARSPTHRTGEGTPIPEPADNWSCSATPPRPGSSAFPVSHRRSVHTPTELPGTGRRAWCTLALKHRVGALRQEKADAALRQALQRTATEAQGTGEASEEARGRLIIVACRLPIEVTKVQDAADPRGWRWDVRDNGNEILAPALRHLGEQGVHIQDQEAGKDRRARLRWYAVGWVGTHVAHEERLELRNVLISQHNCIPIFLEEHEVASYYGGFCKGVLWPMLHYSLRTQNFASQFRHFDMYSKVNERYANAAVQLLRRGDVVWVHDYHLLLAARTIREKMPGAKVGLFVHTPFPSVELFKQLPVRSELLSGMLAADVVGFNAYSYCWQFEESCVALLGIDLGKGGLLTEDGRFVKTHTAPAGVDCADLKRMLSDAREQILLKRQQFDGFHIIVGRTHKLDQRAGTLQRFHAFEGLLKRHKSWRGKVVLLEVIDQPASETDQRMQCLVQETAGRINGAYGELKDIGRPPPVHLIQPRDASQAHGKVDLAALLASAHVLLITPLRDGLNLASHDAVVCQADIPAADGAQAIAGNKAPLILSEFAGASHALGGSLTVNAYDECGIERELLRALRMSPAEREARHQQNMHYVQRNTVQFWAEECMKELLGEGQDNRRVAHGVELDASALSTLRSDFAGAATRLLLLDWDGCMVPLVPLSKTQDPKRIEEAISIVGRFCSDPANMVYILSGRTREQMEEIAGEMKVGLICENGAFVRLHDDPEWLTLSGMPSLWKRPVHELLCDYSDRCPGSIVEQKDATLTWHWREADHEFASWMEKDLTVQLHARMQEHPFTCFSGRRALEVTPQGCSKANAVGWLLEGPCHPDFVLAIGDDRGDEELFKQLVATYCSREQTDWGRQWTPPTRLLPVPSDKLGLGVPVLPLGGAVVDNPSPTAPGASDSRGRSAPGGSRGRKGGSPHRGRAVSLQVLMKSAANSVSKGFQTVAALRRSPAAPPVEVTTPPQPHISVSSARQGGSLRGSYARVHYAPLGAGTSAPPGSPCGVRSQASFSEAPPEVLCWTLRVGEAAAAQNTHARALIDSHKSLMRIVLNLADPLQRGESIRPLKDQSTTKEHQPPISPRRRRSFGLSPGPESVGGTFTSQTPTGFE
eukprot:TRINITY_DN520_c0_g1_i3.p1 TRINITY_DN520_c0_g1~~TRINITY_DN520_c0_g1_i3.p1  ORF type:complete len:1189 (+),score=333.31 TRINITY_DN520_c0_g1_i3:150-3569(+)